MAAAALLAALAIPAAAGPPTAGIAQGTAGFACVSCLVLDVPASAVTPLDLPAGSLDGVAIAVRGAGDAAEAARRRLASAGARVDIAIVDPQPGLDLDAQVFAARSTATALRAARPGIEIAVDADAFRRAGVPLDRLRPYVDLTLVRAEAPSPPTAETLVEASLAPGGERVRVAADAVDWDAVAEFAARRATVVDVTAARGLTADEIVARHQARRRRQQSLLEGTIGRGTTTIVFEVPGFAAPVTIAAQTTVYARGETSDIEQRDIRVNGAAVAGGSADEPPRLPLLEPERIATPPLVISLGDAYTYRLAATEDLDGVETYVVAFEPRGAAGLARGRAWIDARRFALRRLQIVQDVTRGPIVSSEQVQEFGTFETGGGQVELPVRTRVFQMYEGAGHRTPIHRDLSIAAYDINPADYEAQLQAAHASPHLMLRETAHGLQYLLRPRGRAEGERVAAAAAGQRIRTAVAGVLVDPNISDPLPFAGLSYVDLDLFGTGAQLNVFFGGTYGQVSWSVPAAAGSRWHLQGRAFAIAARYNDRSFRGGVERYDENVRQRPAHLSAGAVRQLTERLRVRLEYELDVTGFSRASSTAADFVVPADAIVHGFAGALEAERGPWTVRGWWNPARRQAWRAWGRDAQADRGARDFQRYGASVRRTLALGPALGSRIEAAWMDGHDLDRFSRYTFDSFENRLHGYPTASIRYDRGVVARSATSWNGRGWRLDGFADMAVVRDPGFGERLRGYPGAGIAVEAGGPFRTLLSVEWGYGFRARRRDGGAGTQAVRITAYRMF